MKDILCKECISVNYKDCKECNDKRQILLMIAYVKDETLMLYRQMHDLETMIKKMLKDEEER